MTTRLIIGTNCEIVGFSTKQKGYGRQALFVDLRRSYNGEVIKNIYVKDVFPNVLEDLNILLESDSVYDEELECYTDLNGNGKFEITYKNITEALNSILKDEEFETEVPDLFVIGWHNGREERYYTGKDELGTSIMNAADTFPSIEEAQETIIEEGIKCGYILEFTE